MRIIFSGAQGTGKSTLVREVSKAFPYLEIIDSISAKHSKSKEDFKSQSTVRTFQTNLSLEYFDILTNTENYISSRGFADIYAYCHYNKKKWGLDISKRFKLLEKMCYSFETENNKENTFIFYVPIMFEPEATELRSGDKRFQYEIDTYIRDFLKNRKYNPYSESKPYYKEIESLSVEDRVKEVVSFIGELKK